MTVWDLKTKKASLTLNNNRKRVSAIAWDPNNSTKLLTATPDDSAPVILLWDLRNSNAPERTMQGHEQGVLSLSWCEQDADLLLSCGKDNRTLVWNPQTGERYGEFPEVTNWTFLTRFSPNNPSLSATASFDGKIAIQTLQNTNPSNTQNTTQNSLDGEDFFTSAQTQPQGASFSLPKAPAWLQRPVGVSFGFGGKVVVLKKNKVSITQFSVDSDVTAEAEKFENSLHNGDIKAICASHLEQAKTEEDKADWIVMETLVAADPRQQVIDYLGFRKEEEQQEATNGGETPKEEKAAELSVPKENGDAKSKHKRIGSMFDGPGGEDFLSGLAANKGAKTEDPFHLLSSEGSNTLEDSITKALMLGNFAKAAEVCLKEDRIADAFIIANCGGKDLVDKVQAAYLSNKKGSPSYLRLLSSVVAGNLWDVVYNADLANWKETMATLCTFAKPDEFPDLCEALGDRILEQGSRKDASFCFLVGSKLEKAVTIWIEELEEAEQAGLKEENEGSTFSVHAKTLQQFIEKVTVFRQVTKFTDKETTQTSDWKLASLYDKYTEYADIVAAHGLLSVAEKYLDLLPATYPAAEVARERVKLATKKAPAQPTVRQTAASTRPATRQPPAAYAQQQPLGYQPPQQVPTNTLGSRTPAAPFQPVNTQYAPPGGAPPNPYGPTAPTPASNPYAPAAINPYAPSGAGPYQPTGGYAPPQPAGFTPYGQTAMAPPPLGGPPRGPTASTNPPLLRAKDVGEWNDTPEVVKAPRRKNTPRQVVGSPFPGQQTPGMAPPQTAYGAPPRGTATPPPPPPKAGSGPPQVTSPLAGPPQAGQLPFRPSSTVSNSYAPPPPMAGAVPPPSASPYNAPPPAGLPPSNRYAPAPAAQQVHQQPQMPPPGVSMPPPPGASRPPPANPYAPAGAAPGQFAPSPYSQPPPHFEQPPSAPPPSAGRPPMGGPPMGGPPQNAAAPPPPQAAAPPPKPRHPAGDRSHIPNNAQELVNILSQDMQRVASKAPANFAPQVKDTQKRLNLLFDHLNNDELVQPATIEQLSELARYLAGRNYDAAQQIQLEIQKTKTEECGNWMVSFDLSCALQRLH